MNYIYHAEKSSYMDSLYHASRLQVDEPIFNSFSDRMKYKAKEAYRESKSGFANAASNLSRMANKKEREWKKHKWVARKRGKNGKWIYDYGNGFPTKEERRKGARVSKFKELDRDSKDYIVRNGNKIRKTESGEAFIKTRNPYKSNYYGRTPTEVSRIANKDQQRRSHSLKTKRGRQVY